MSGKNYVIFRHTLYLSVTKKCKKNKLQSALNEELRVLESLIYLPLSHLYSSLYSNNRYITILVIHIRSHLVIDLYKYMQLFSVNGVKNIDKAHYISLKILLVQKQPQDTYVAKNTCTFIFKLKTKAYYCRVCESTSQI